MTLHQAKEMLKAWERHIKEEESIFSSSIDDMKSLQNAYNAYMNYVNGADATLTVKRPKNKRLLLI